MDQNLLCHIFGLMKPRLHPFTSYVIDLLVPALPGRGHASAAARRREDRGAPGDDFGLCSGVSVDWVLSDH